MIDVALMQKQHKTWQERNFPNQTSDQALMGMVEEMGELAHAHLKHQQGIRGMNDTEFKEKAMDAIADLFIFSLGYCNAVPIDLEFALFTTWQKVMTRDWVADPEGAGND